jgi:hypothetical protein
MMKRREQGHQGSQCLVEFSAERIELVSDGRERQRQVYQLQNRGASSVRVHAAISADSDPVFHLVSGSDEKYVAPGLKLPVVLQYCPASEEDSLRGGQPQRQSGSLCECKPPPHCSYDSSSTVSEAPSGEECG